MKKKGKRMLKPPAPFTEALAVIREHPGLTLDGFFEVLSIRGYDVTNLDVIEEGDEFFDAPMVHDIHCSSCQHPVSLSMTTICSLCPARICDNCLYLCHGCEQPVCVDHIHQYPPNLSLCAACDPVAFD